MNKSFNKGQAALEFLTTYGWAFLVILIMIGALAYFGVLNPSKLLPNRCQFSSEFQCLDYQISATSNTFNLKLKSNSGDPIQISAITLSSDTATQFSCTTTPTLNVAIPSGNITNMLFSVCNPSTVGWNAGDKGKVYVTLTYFSVASGASYSKASKGEILTTLV